MKGLTIVLQVTGKCGSVRVRLIPAPRGTGNCYDNDIIPILSRLYNGP